MDLCIYVLHDRYIPLVGIFLIDISQGHVHTNSFYCRY